MIVILLVSLLTVVSCLEPAANNNITDKIKTIIGKYISNIPDINSRYVINDELSKVINHYFKGKVNPLPLYKISLTLDRNPVKIPWTIDNVQGQEGENEVYKEVSDKAGKKEKKRHYKVLKSVGSKDLPKSKKTLDTSTESPSPLASSPPTTSPPAEVQ
ncbi:uncharacterized protein LOC110370583 [Helicoverpa armigera]|uniref:uncharacterized protein LOC110370583 n=1 Tax=Helicoverpa armigera TaxID=29058 RepID=UPI003082799A